MSSRLLPLQPAHPWSPTLCLPASFLIDLCSWGNESKGLERKLCSVTCTSQYIYWWGYSRHCHSFREWVFFFWQSNPECKQGKASFQKPLVQFLWIKTLWWGGEGKCYALVIEFGTTCTPRLFSPPRIDGFGSGHVVATRSDWTATCNWAEVSFIAFWTAELVSDTRGNSRSWQKRSERPRRETENWEGWEFYGMGAWSFLNPWRRKRSTG